jgi:hypothetical protein
LRYAASASTCSAGLPTSAFLKPVIDAVFVRSVPMNTTFTESSVTPGPAPDVPA